MQACERVSMPCATDNFPAHAPGGDYRAVAEALGGWGTRVESPDAFIPALHQAVEVTRTGRPALIECITKECHDISRYP